MKRSTLLLSTALLTVAVAGCGGSSKPSAAPSDIASETATTDPTGEASPTDSGSPKYDDEPSAATASAPCGTKTTAHADVATKLPKGFPPVTGWTPTVAVTQGKTIAVRGVVTGVPTDIVKVRDEAFTKITAAGYMKTGSDEEPGFEADGDFMPKDGNINVKTLCKGYLVVSYSFSQ